MAKKSKKAVTSTSYASLVSFEAIKSVVEVHNQRVGDLVKNHLKAVDRHTGSLLPEDVTYVINLSNRELSYSIKKLFEPNVL
jgi:hypothetical protein